MQHQNCSFPFYVRLTTECKGCNGFSRRRIARLEVRTVSQ
nr:MAG TPA: hypothetical protein [Caudoviricetes sp.]